MSSLTKKGFPLIGVIFLALALFKFLSGGGWVVWLILGLLFGGASGVQRLMNRQGDA